MGWIILLWVIALGVIGAFGYLAYYFLTDHQYYSKKKKPKLGYTFVSLGIVTFIIAILLTFRLTETESFKRFTKSLNSEFNGGITREVIVYSEGGEVIYQDKGTFDVEHIDGRIKYVDEEGQVQIIYLGNSATAVVNELAK